MEGVRTVVVQGEAPAKLGDRERRHWTCDQIVC